MRSSRILQFISVLLSVINVIKCKYTVTTKYGVIEGLITEKCKMFLGVPFASPPDRWKEAVEPQKWEGVLETKAMKPMCYQPKCSNTFACIDVMSEDCLYLNIYVPSDTNTNSRKAVMVWIHGGAFHTGSGAAPVYRSEDFAKNGNVIYVNINYRLGAFGFLKTGSGTDAATGNYGFEDQRLAMKWVKENIEAFGGNPEKVTVFGQSAGASSLLLHLFSSKSEHLFDQAIVQSPPIAIQAKDPKVVENQGALLAKFLDCGVGDMTCIRDKRAEEIIIAQEKAGAGSENYFDMFTAWGPYVDGSDVTHKAIEASQKGLLFPKPVIFGTNYDEGVAYIYDNIKSALPAFVFSYLIRIWRQCLELPTSVKAPNKKMTCKNHDSDIIYRKYKPVSKSDARPEYSALLTEFIFTCPVRNITRNHKTTVNDVWMYVFNQTYPLPDIFAISKCVTHACHAVELPFLFQSIYKLGIPAFPSEGDLRLGKDMLSYWTNFAKTGNPNDEDMMQWPRYDRESDNYMHFKSSGNEVITEYRDDICNFLDGIGYD